MLHEILCPKIIRWKIYLHIFEVHLLSSITFRHKIVKLWMEFFLIMNCCYLTCRFDLHVTYIVNCNKQTFILIGNLSGRCHLFPIRCTKPKNSDLSWWVVFTFSKGQRALNEQLSKSPNLQSFRHVVLRFWFQGTRHRRYV